MEDLEGNIILYIWNSIASSTLHTPSDTQWVCKANTMASVEHSDVNYPELLPFYSLTDYHVESEFISTKRQFVNWINHEKFENFLK